MKRLLFASTLSVLMLLGAGCSWLGGPSSSTSTASGAGLVSLKPEDAANKLQFLPGDTLEIQQTVAGATLPDWLRSKDGVRQVTITEFAPANTASLRWSTTMEKETAASQKAKTEYEAKLKSAKGDALAELMKSPPKIEYETSNASGTVSAIQLQASHQLALPFAWPASKDLSLATGSSAIWLSDDAFLELHNTKRTVLNLGFFDEAANAMLKNAKELKAAMDRLKTQAVNQEKSTGEDLTLVKAEPEFIEWPLKVNGQEIKVSAIRGKNWFGEFVVLNNRQNPMVLKLSVNPVTAAAAQAVGGSVDVNQAIGFEVNNLVVAFAK